MQATKHDAKLEAKLNRFEQRLETPIVPGELVGWLDLVGESAREVTSDLRKHVTRNHASLFDEILRHDLSLASRVDEMRKQDINLIAKLQELSNVFAELRRRSAASEPDEAAVKDDVEQAANDALRHILEVRKQEAAVTTWFMESFDRDRGTAD